MFIPLEIWPGHHGRELGLHASAANNTLLPVAGSDSHDPDVITYSDILKVMKVALDDPMKFFPQLPDLLTSVSNGGSGADLVTFK